MTSNGERKLDEVFGQDQPAKLSDLKQVCEETEQILTEMKEVINVHAEAIAFHRYAIEKFIPAPLFAAAAKEYYEARQREIDIEVGTAAIDAQQAN